MSDPSAPLRSELIDKLGTEAKAYDDTGKWEEITYWIGSAVSAIASVFAGLNISINIGQSGNSKETIAVSAILAIIPALWAAIEKTINLRRLAAFNYTVAAQLHALHIELKFNLQATIENASMRYAEIVKTESVMFSTLMNSYDSAVKPSEQAKPPEQKAAEQKIT